MTRPPRGRAQKKSAPAKRAKNSPRSRSPRSRSPRSRSPRSRSPRSRSPRARSPASDPGAAFSALADAALARGEPDAVSDEQLRQVLAAAVKIYAAKAERRGDEPKPFADGAVTPTETVVAACAMIRAADLNLFDVAMWFHRAASLA